MLALDRDQLRAAQRRGEAEQQQGAVAQPGEVAAAGGEQAPELGGADRRGPARRPAVPAEDPGQGVADGRMRRGPGQAGHPVRPADGGQAAAQGGAAVAQCQGGAVAGHRGGCGRQRGDAALLAPGGKGGPVGGIGPQGRRGERLAGVAGGQRQQGPIGHSVRCAVGLGAADWVRGGRQEGEVGQRGIPVACAGRAAIMARPTPPSLQPDL